MSDWYDRQTGKVALSGAATGVMGGPVGLAAIIPDLMWCGRVGAHGCYGIGHILGREVDYDQDMDYILSVWSEAVEAAMNIPAGKVGIKIFGKAAIAPMAGHLAGTIVSKATLKGGSKLAAKLAAKSVSKATAKLAAKLTAKAGFSWIPLVGGVASAGVNVWLVRGLMKAAEQYYRHDYLVIQDPELAAEALRSA